MLRTISRYPTLGFDGQVEQMMIFLSALAETGETRFIPEKQDFEAVPVIPERNTIVREKHYSRDSTVTEILEKNANDPCVAANRREVQRTRVGCILYINGGFVVDEDLYDLTVATGRC